MIREFAPAKVNLFLHVGGARADGYHDIESLAVFASVGDELVLEEADELSLHVEGPFAAALSGAESDNLILRAARVFGELAQTEPCVRVTLTKNLPVASGIGGGSSDAAATLRGLARTYPGRTNLQGLWNFAGRLGSDVTACVLPGCWWMSGRGERLATCGEVGTFDAVLVNAGVPVSTAAAYGALRNRTGLGQLPRPTRRFATVEDLADYLGGARNDLEELARRLSPVIAEQTDALARTQPLLVRMSGSGGTCFGIYRDAVSAQAAAQTILADHPNWWVMPTRLNFGRKWDFQ